MEGFFQTVKYGIFILFSLWAYGCNPRTNTGKTISNEQAPITDECAMKEEVCAEAFDFQKEYERLPDEEKKDMISVLNTYISHCEEATKGCEKSKK